VGHAAGELGVRPQVFLIGADLRDFEIGEPTTTAWATPISIRAVRRPGGVSLTEPRLNWLLASAGCCTLVLPLSCWGRSVAGDNKTVMRYSGCVVLALAGLGCAAVSRWGLRTCLELLTGLVGAFVLLLLFIRMVGGFVHGRSPVAANTLCAVPFVLLGLAILGGLSGAVYEVVALLQGASDPIRSAEGLLLGVAAMEIGWCYLKAFHYGFT